MISVKQGCGLGSLSGVSKRALWLMAATVVAVSMPWCAPAVGTWTPIAALAPEGINTMLLLPDGTVMAAGASMNTWYRLTPNSQGSYVNSTWSTLAPMNFTRLYYSSAVLTNGTVLV